MHMRLSLPVDFPVNMKPTTTSYESNKQNEKQNNPLSSHRIVVKKKKKGDVIFMRNKENSNCVSECIMWVSLRDIY